MNTGMRLVRRSIVLFVTITLLLLPYHWTFQSPSQELEVLTLARQIADPGWLPQDWFLSQMTPHSGLFTSFASGLVWLFGETGTIVVGRLFGYGLLAIGLTLITHQLKLRLGATILAITLWLGFNHLVPIESASRVYFSFAGVTIASLLLVCTGRFPNLKRHYLKLFLLVYGLLLAANDPQSVITGELPLPDFGGQSLAYGCITIAIGLFLRDQRNFAALMAGLATSLHPLFGGCGFLVLLTGWLLEDIFLGTLRTRYLWKVAFPFAIGAIGTWPQLWRTLTTPRLTSMSDVTAPEIAVFFRFADYLNPEIWQTSGWLKLATYLLVLALSVYMIAVTQRRANLEIDRSFAQRRALLVVFVCAIPFAFGVWLTGNNPNWLQYSLFSLLNTVLPLFTLLFFVRALQSIGTLGISRISMAGLCWVLIVPILIRTSLDFVPLLNSSTGGLNSGLKPNTRDLYAWIQTQTPDDATIITPPDSKGFQLLAQRGTVATFDFLPTTDSAILAWFDRLNDLTAGEAKRLFTAVQSDRPLHTSKVRTALTDAYKRLSLDQAIALMERYEAACFVTTPQATFAQTADYQNSSYAVYCHDAIAPADRSQEPAG